MTALEPVRVPVGETEIYSVLIDGEPHVVLRPAVEAMGLDYATQLRKLRARSWAVVGQTPTTGADGKTYEMATVDLDTWSMLLANINENRVSDRARPVVVEYQKRSARALREYWTGTRTEPAPLNELEVARRYVLALERQQALEAQNAQQRAQLAIAAPKAEYVDSFVNPTEDASTIRVFAGQINVGEQALRDYLRQRKVIYRRLVEHRWSRSKQAKEPVYEWLAYSEYRTWFQAVDQPQAPRLHNGQMSTTLYVTPVGKAAIRRLLMKHPMAEDGAA